MVRRYPRPAFLALLCVTGGLSGCSGPVETRIMAGGPGIPGRSTLMWADGQAGSPLEVRARSDVEAALRQQGFVFSDDAPVMVTLGLAERPGGIGLQEGRAADGTPIAAGPALSPGKRRRLLQSCADHIVRLSLGLLDRAGGAVLYSGSAQEAHCHAGIADVTPRLARLAVADLRAPSGERIVLTRARD